LFAVTLLVCGFRLDLPDICGDDEAFDAGIVWEMAENGHWLFPSFNGESVPEKPPLFFWIAAGISRVRNRVDEISVRLPSVLMAAVTVVTVFLAGRCLVGAPVAFLASLITLSAPMTIARAHVGRVDMTLVACTTGAFFAAAFGLAPDAPRWRRTVFWVLAALAVLTKGGAGLGIVVCGTLAVAIADRKRLWTLVTPEGLVAFVLFAFGWYVAAMWTLGHRFVEVNLLRENLELFVGDASVAALIQRIRSLFDPALSLFGGLMPWSFIAAFAFHDWRTALQGGSKSSLAWAAGGLVFFTAADARHTHYVAPLLPPFALVIAQVLSSKRSPISPRWMKAALLAVLVSVILAIGAVPLLRAWAASGWAGVSSSDEQNVIPLWLWGSRRPAASILLVILAVAILLFISLTWQRKAGWVLTALLASLVVQGALHEVLGAATNSRFSLKTFAREVSRVEGPIYFYGPPSSQIVFHARRHIHQVPVGNRPVEPFFVIATERQLAELSSTYLLREVAAGDGRLGQSGHERVLLLGTEGH
jgi:4-amino-4-deoxy-L-arabinose transferase-like glycosyltransferase